MITKKYYKLIRVSHADSGYFYIKNVSNEVGEFKINNYGSGTMEYSLDGVTWTSYNLSTKPTVNVNPGSNIYLRGTNFKHNNTGNVLSFNKSYNICGNFMSVSNYSTMSSVSEINLSNRIRSTFYNQSNLVSAADLNFGNVTTVGEDGLKGVFTGCTSLTTPPDFSNLTTIGRQGLQETFYGCTSLTTPPDLSNVTTIGESGLISFLGECNSLTTGPDLSNVTTIGSGGLFNAFSSCTKLSTVTAPNISDLTQNNVLYGWLTGAGTQATGTKVVNVPTGATIATDSNSGIPTGWTRVDY